MSGTQTQPQAATPAAGPRQARLFLSRLDPWTVMKTAFVLSLVAPTVPAGASWGERRSYQGMSLRVLRDYDPTPAGGGPPKDRLLTDTFMGTATTKDRGTIDGDGRFVPTEDGDDSAILVRAVKIDLGGGGS